MKRLWSASHTSRFIKLRICVAEISRALSIMLLLCRAVEVRIYVAEIFQALIFLRGMSIPVGTRPMAALELAFFISTRGG